MERLSGIERLFVGLLTVPAATAAVAGFSHASMSDVHLSLTTPPIAYSSLAALVAFRTRQGILDASEEALTAFIVGAGASAAATALGYAAGYIAGSASRYL